ncbi:extracellular solute-binding protein [Aureibacillus halotolerans]|uniref:Putative aldouronate transport system substrate-binding protein n=1 Tax=Aureibacillus halotolerans TaxID=1508390 RepID=A0A4R6U8Z7_9BACI|nr:extracellular solute-binding protein [Aureibacillus halotolerans]TDQ42891.1 putative aldouronate transport system substrate-binding protein [Aureibacillus halotolerans]
MKSLTLKMLLASTCFVLVIAGCSADQASDANEGSEDGRLNLTVGMNFDGVEFPQADNEIERIIEDYTGVDLSIQAYPSATYGEKLPVMVASGDLPKAVYTNMDGAYMENALQNGVFWEIGPYLEDYPNLSSIDDIIYKNTSFKGKIYGLPKVREIARDVFIYRHDWLENVGLEEPETIDDFYNVMKAFTTEDPDQNGEDDTYGMSISGIGSAMYRIAPMMGAPNTWKEEDGVFTHATSTDGYMEALKFIKKLYDEELINRNFAVIERSQWEEEFAGGTAGIWPDVSIIAETMETRIAQTYPDSSVRVFAGLAPEEGGELRVAAGSGANGVFLFPKPAVKSEEELKQILGFYEKLAEEPMANLFKWGIEGVHYEKTDDGVEKLDGGDFQNDIHLPYRLPMGIVPAEVNAIENELTPLQKDVAETLEENLEAAVHNPTMSLTSQTSAEKGGQLSTIIDDANTKFVMGEINEEEWQAEIEKWRKSGGEQVAKEYGESFAELQ